MISVGCFSTGADLNAILVACDLFTQKTLAFLKLFVSVVVSLVFTMYLSILVKLS